MEDYRLRNRVFTLEKSVDELQKLAHNISTSLEKVLKELDELKQRLCEDDLR